MYAVLVGVSEYRLAKNNLNYSHLDALKMYELLKLHTPASNLRILVNGEATKDRIVKETQELFAKSLPEDIVIFFFSGHGNTDCFFTHDAALTSPTIRALFKATKAKRKMIFADACFSGSFRTQGKRQTGESMENNNANVLLFLSSRSNQASVEAVDMKGVFTFFLVAGLKGGADANRDKKITAKELFDFVNPRVKERTNGMQVPVMWGKFDDDMIIMNWEK
jgi:uncharacterized caspase-like protein